METTYVKQPLKNLSNFQYSYCTSHGEVKFLYSHSYYQINSLICLLCKKYVCMKCLIDGEQDHLQQGKIQDIGSILQNYSDNTYEILQSQFEKINHKISQFQTNINENFDNLVSIINQTFDNLKKEIFELIDREKEELQNKLSIKKHNDMKKLTKFKKLISLSKLELTSLGNELNEEMSIDNSNTMISRISIFNHNCNYLENKLQENQKFQINTDEITNALNIFQEEQIKNFQVKSQFMLNKDLIRIPFKNNYFLNKNFPKYSKQIEKSQNLVNSKKIKFIVSLDNTQFATVIETTLSASQVRIEIWDYNSKENKITKIRTHDLAGPIKQCFYLHNQKHLILLKSGDSKIYFYNFITNQCDQIISPFNAELTTFAYIFLLKIQKQNCLAIGNDCSKIQIFRLPFTNFQPTYSINLQDHKPCKLLYLNSRNALLSIDNNHDQMKLWHIPTKRCVKNIPKVINKPVEKVIYDKEKKILFCQFDTPEQCILIWNTLTWRLIKKINGEFNLYYWPEISLYFTSHIPKNSASKQLKLWKISPRVACDLNIKIKKEKTPKIAFLSQNTSIIIAEDDDHFKCISYN